MYAEGFTTNSNINNLPINYAEIACPYLMFYQAYNQFGTKIYFFQPNMINNISYSTNKFSFEDQNNQNPNLNDLFIFCRNKHLASDTLRTLKSQQESCDVKLEYQTQDEKNIGTLRNIKKIYQEEKKKKIKQKDEKKEKTEKKEKKIQQRYSINAFQGHWTQKEQRSFDMFLLKNESIMQDP